MTKQTDTGGVEGDRPGETDGRWRQVVQRSYDPDGPGDLTAAIALAVAEATGKSPTTLEPPLYDSVDGETIEELFDWGATTEVGTTDARLVEFRYDDNLVTVRANGRIGVATQAPPDRSEPAE
jgi:hypothetical protein